jgi:putative membrane protein
MMGYGWGMTGVGWFGMMLFWVLVIVAVVFLVRSFEGFWPRLPRADRSLEIARERFAKGELTREEFEAVKKSLQA